MTATTVVYLIFTHIHILIDALESNVGIAGCVKMSEFGVEELAQWEEWALISTRQTTFGMNVGLAFLSDLS